MFNESLMYLQGIAFIWEQVAYFHILLYLRERSFTYQEEVLHIFRKYYIYYGEVLYILRKYYIYIY